MARAEGGAPLPFRRERRSELWQHRNTIRAALIGLPNAGKTGLFNVLTGNRSPVDDAVFTTVREAYGVAVHDDPRFFWLCEHFAPGLAVPSRIRVVDLPGIVPGSYKGAGLGCEVFRTHAAASDVLLLVIRSFDGQQVTQCVGDTTNPLRDLDYVLSELVAIDRATVGRLWSEKVAFVERKQGGSQLLAEFKSLEKIQDYLKKTKKPIRFGLEWDDQDLTVIRKYKLLTAKEVVFVINLPARDYLRPAEVHNSHTSLLGRVRDFLKREGHETSAAASVICPFSGEFEARLQALRCGPVYGAGIRSAPEPLASAAAFRAGLAVEGIGAASPSVAGGGGSGGGGGEASSGAGSSGDDMTTFPRQRKLRIVPGQGGAQLAGPLPPPSAAVDVALAAAGGVVDDRRGGRHPWNDAALAEEEGVDAVKSYLDANPTHHSARSNVLASAFNALNVVHFFTVGPEEVRSWTLPRGVRAPKAAGVIHRDFEADFVSVEVESFLDLQELGSEVAVMRQGKLTQQGLKYVVQDGDICFFRFKLPNYKPFRG